jgi:hypothetical protein
VRALVKVTNTLSTLSLSLSLLLFSLSLHNNLTQSLCMCV